MTVSPNPFASPESELEQRPTRREVGGSVGQYRFDKVLVHHREGAFADRCIKCNQPARGEKLQRTVYWHHPGFYLLIIPGLLIYALVALAVRKKATVSVGLCEEHRSSRRTAIIVGWVGALLGIGSCTGGMSTDSGGIALFGILILVVATIFGAFGARSVYPTKIDDHYVYLRGVCEAYLLRLPPWSRS